MKKREIVERLIEVEKNYLEAKRKVNELGKRIDDIDIQSQNDKFVISIITEERIVFELIVNNDKVFLYLKNKLKLTSDFFYSDSAKNIYNAIESLYEKYQGIYDILPKANEEIDKRINDYLMELKADTMTMPTDTKRILNDAIIGIELKKVEQEIQEITQSQKSDNSIQLENLIKLTELNQRKLYLKKTLNIDNIRWINKGSLNA